MISMILRLKNGHKQIYDEINKIEVSGSVMTISTFKSQYICINLDDLSSFELKYPQSKSAKAFAIFKQVVNELGGELNDNEND